MTWLRYDETEHIQQAATDKKEILKNKNMLHAVKKVADNLSITKDIAKLMFESIWTSKGYDEEHSEHKSDWVSTMARRFRNICRCTQQACSGKKPASWTSDLPWMQEDASAASSSSAAPKLAQPSSVDDFFFGWSEELRKAWRQAIKGHDRGPREVCVNFKKPEDAKPTDAMIGVWSDGMCRAIAQYTVEDHAVPHHGKKTTTVHHWEGEHETTKNRLTVSLRKDRSLLSTLDEQGRMVCMMKVSVYGGEDEEHQEQALKAMTIIGIAYAADKITRAELYGERDKVLISLGVTKKGARPTRTVKSKEINDDGTKAASKSRGKSCGKALPKKAATVKKEQPDGATSKKKAKTNVGDTVPGKTKGQKKSDEGEEEEQDEMGSKKCEEPDAQETKDERPAAALAIMKKPAAAPPMKKKPCMSVAAIAEIQEDESENEMAIIEFKFTPPQNLTILSLRFSFFEASNLNPNI
jgi:hypothetical protein